MSPSSTTDVEPPDWRAIVGELVGEARRTAGNAEALSQQLEALGVRGERGTRYSMSAISNWVKGRTMPPADVLLAAAISSGQSLDAKLAERVGTTRANRVDNGIDDLRVEVARLQAEMINLQGRIAQPNGSTTAADTEGGAGRTGTDDR